MTSYLGGKSRIGKEIATLITSLDPLHGQSSYWEPFVGMAGVMRHITSPVRVGSDIHFELISMWQALQDGWIPPEYCSEEEYRYVKKYPQAVPPYVRAFLGHGCSTVGHYFHSYAKSKTRNYCGEAQRGVLKCLERVKDVIFACCSYDAISFSDLSGWMIYCDPPYRNSEKVGNHTPFNHDAFFQWARHMSKRNIVVISERTAPNDFICIWKKQIRSATFKRKDITTENLFIHKDVLARLL